MIHAVYLLNCASEDPEIRSKSLEALKVALNAGAQLGAVGVVLHPGSALKDGGPVDAAIKRAAEVIQEALKESEKCPLLLEDTAGAGGTLGRSFEELAELIDSGRRRRPARHLPGLLPPVRVRLRRAHRGVPARGDRRVRQGRRL